MYYGKLPIIFLSVIASENDGTTNCQIAKFILANINEVKNLTISELASKCHVANSSISRFCREIGLDDYSELRKLINTNSMKFQLYFDKENSKERSLGFSKSVVHSIEKVSDTINYEAIDNLVRDIYKYEDVACFGLLKAQTAAMNLQSDLLMLGKVATSKLPFYEQLKYIENADENSLIIIFSFTGIYFDYWYPKRTPKYKEGKPKIYFITSDKRAMENKYFDEVIYFDSLQDYASHPFQLQFIASLIAQSYAQYIKS